MLESTAVNSKAVLSSSWPTIAENGKLGTDPEIAFLHKDYFIL